jgi:two-component sensor histidine kinase
MEKDLNELTDTQLELVRLVMQSAKELDEVIKDLNKIIDIRNDIYRIREKVYFKEELNMVLRSLSTFIQPDVKIETDFREAPIVYTIRPILTSILYNLISNAIKYRSPQRPLQLLIKTTQVNNAITLQISDNGLGMNLEQFSRSIFGMYKRFHTHTDGKGLGLYLVKLQIESLGGKVEVTSELNVGTTFNVSFPDMREVEGQIVFESDFGSIFYNARTNCAGIIWKKQVTSEQYRTLFAKCLEMVRLYHTPYWISDLSKQGTISPDDQKWMVTTIMPEAIRQGLRKIANVYFEGQNNDDYRKRIRETSNKLGVGIEFFTDRKKAEDWIDDSIES